MDSLFEREAGEVPALAAGQHHRLSQIMPPLIERLGRLSPHLAATIARGSSDHAAEFAGYLFGLLLGLPTASIPPSLASVYRRSLRLDRALVVAISQSGASPDLLAAVRSARANGACTLGLVNLETSPLASAVDAVLPIGAGNEQAVAATKTFMLSATAIAHLVARWSNDRPLLDALARLPDALRDCASADWSAAVDMLAEHDSCFVVGRGPGLPLARELALKLKEACGLHAEALSAAELLHGPIAIASPQLPSIVIGGDESSRETLLAAIAKLHFARSPVIVISGTEEDAAATRIRIPDASHPLLQPLLAMQSTYPMLAALARARGRDPDRPRQLQKITRTL
jgi:glucosamine--fructose-6-phosphate aminotransferase (isomerizing)